MKMVYLRRSFAGCVQPVPQMLDKAAGRPFMVVDVGLKGKSFFCPLHTIDSDDPRKLPRLWAFQTRRTEKGREYLDFRKGFVANYEQAAGGYFRMDDEVFALVASNKRAWQSIARDRIYNPANLVDDYAVDLAAVEEKIERELGKPQRERKRGPGNET